MSFTISELSNILKTASSPQEAKALIKLLSVDVTKSLGDGKYLLENSSTKVIASSDKPLLEGGKYWLELASKHNEMPLITKFLQQPTMLKEFANIPLKFDTKELHELLSGKKTIESFKMDLLEHLSNASNKEDFTQISNLILSLIQNTLTIPLTFQHYFGVFQMKKRYNKTSKKSQLDFYASLAKLGPISGTVMLLEDEILIDLDVAFTTTKLFLEENLKDIRYKTTLHVSENIQALYQFHSNSILDINV
jgi:hypothetical protein